MDRRIEQAQQLFWEVGRLRDEGLHRAALPRLVKMAGLHEERALELLGNRAADGWADLYAAITAWGEAGHRGDAERLVAVGRRRSALFGEGSQNILCQLDDLAVWLDSLHIVPSLGDFARPLPAMAPEAA